MGNDIYGQISDSVLRGLLGSLGDGLILTDLEEKITYINKNAKRILGWEDKQALGRSFSEVCPLVNLKTGRNFQSPLRVALTERRSVGLARNIGILRGEQQEAIYLSATCSPLHLDEGEIVGCAVILRNITHLRRLEVRLEADHVYMRTVFSAAQVGLCVLDEKGAIVDINDAGLETMETTYRDSVGKQFGDVFRCENSFEGGCGHGQYCATCPIRHQIETAIATEGYTSQITAAMHSIRRKERIWLRMFFSQAWSEMGKQTIVTMIDVSQRKKKEDALEEARERAEAASRTKSQFLANMSHEIRTPINGMNGMIDLTLHTDLTEEQRENLMSAKQCSEDLLRIINDILDFSKLDCGKMELESLDFDLHKMLRRVCTVHRKVAKGKGLFFRLPDLKGIPQFITGDPMRFRQIMHNLLNNAVKFTIEGGVAVEAKKVFRKGIPVLSIAIHDTGIGMSFEEQKKLFQPFSQVDGSTTRKFGGTGLGLMIVKDLVEAMGGEISAHSAPQCGSNFTFWIPLYEADGEDEESQERSVFINECWNDGEIRDNQPKAVEETDLSDIASLLAYCEQRLDEDGGDAS
ncbi:PAS domain S-box-containing protein [Selenomonas sp. GACV-9]|uniref:ATP-binding protein n=1 Tax=Selenomonas sp. GACV-9 TaxID=3158782 RepID=UPI0008EDAC70|nr:PAS domain S-box-containing protein [Selenomonas ruminantium]